MTAALTCLLLGCSNASEAPDAVPSAPSSSEQTSPPDVEVVQGGPYTGYPDAIVVLGHSGSTGESSDPRRPGIEVHENSWATGGNPQVNSVYQRIVALHAPIKSHAFALSEGGATVNQALAQASAAVAQQPRNALILVQLIDNDLVCPAAREDLMRFQTAFETVLATLDRGLPTSRIFVVTQFGSPQTYARALTPAQRRSLGGTGPCSFLDPDGRIVPKELARLEATIQSYEAALGHACAQFDRCVFDHGAFGEAIDRAEYLASDLQHPTVAGHAAAAAIAWQALREGGLVPAGRHTGGSCSCSTTGATCSGDGTQAGFPDALTTWSARQHPSFRTSGGSPSP